MSIQVNVEKTSSVQRKLTIKVPAAMVQKQFERGLAEVQRSARLKGFRPGHAPIGMIRQMYGEDVRHRVFHNLIDETYRDAVREQKLQAIGSPQIDTPHNKTGEGEHDHTLDESKDFTYIATVEVVPEIDVKGYAGLSLTREAAKITDKDVNETLEKLRASQGEVRPVENESTAARMGMFIDMEFKGGLRTENGLDERPGMSGARLIELGSGTLIDGFEDKLVGMKKGETKTFTVPFPKDYFESDLAGKDAEFTVTAKELKERILPEMNDELAKTLGYESLADMKTKAREHLEKEKAAEVDRKLRSDLLSALIEKNPFELPMSLIEAQTRALAQDVAQNLKQQGFTDQMVQEALGSEMENLRKRAESQVRASLLLEAVAKKENITATAQDIDAELATMAKNMGVEESRLREFYHSNPRRRDDLEFRLREDKAIKHVLEKAKIKG